MFYIENNTIHLTRGDKAVINFSIENYTFENGDIVKFLIYYKYGLNSEPILKKEINVKQATDNVDIILNTEDTKIGKISNEPIEYWYEIEFNKGQTVIGYDKNGAKIFKLYPKGGNENGST